MDLQQVWELREEQVYPQLFGQSSPGIVPLSNRAFEGFGRVRVDPRWMHIGVFEFPPTGNRPSWLYVTSGYSNPWGQNPADYDPSGESGIGVEFTLSVSERGEWAIDTLHSMLALDLLLGSGQIPGHLSLAYQDLVPLRAPLDGRPDCLIRNLILTEREDGPEQEFRLPSGRVILAGFTGVTDAERDFAKLHGAPALIDRLRDAGAHPTTNPRRGSIL